MSKLINLNKAKEEKEDLKLLKFSSEMDNLIADAISEVPFCDVVFVFGERLSEMLKILPEEDFQKLDRLIKNLIIEKRNG